MLHRYSGAGSISLHPYPPTTCITTPPQDVYQPALALLVEKELEKYDRVEDFIKSETFKVSREGGRGTRGTGSKWDSKGCKYSFGKFGEVWVRGTSGVTGVLPVQN